MSMPRSLTLLQSHTLGGSLTAEASYSVGAERFLPHRTWFSFCGLSPVIKPTFNVNCEIIDTSRRTLPFPRSSLLPWMKRFSWILSANLLFCPLSSLLLQSYHTNKILSHSWDQRHNSWPIKKSPSFCGKFARNTLSYLAPQRPMSPLRQTWINQPETESAKCNWLLCCICDQPTNMSSSQILHQSKPWEVGQIRSQEVQFQA